MNGGHFSANFRSEICWNLVSDSFVESTDSSKRKRRRSQLWCSQKKDLLKYISSLYLLEMTGRMKNKTSFLSFLCHMCQTSFFFYGGQQEHRRPNERLIHQGFTDKWPQTLIVFVNKRRSWSFVYSKIQTSQGQGNQISRQKREPSQTRYLLQLQILIPKMRRCSKKP